MDDRTANFSSHSHNSRTQQPKRPQRLANNPSAFLNSLIASTPSLRNGADSPAASSGSVFFLLFRR